MPNGTIIYTIVEVSFVEAGAKTDTPTRLAFFGGGPDSLSGLGITGGILLGIECGGNAAIAALNRSSISCCLACVSAHLIYKFTELFAFTEC